MTRDELLEQLRELLGVQVTSVRRLSRRPNWWLTVDRWMSGVPLRNPKQLNAWANEHGRPQGLRPLTAEQGHQAVRLCWQIVEADQ